MRLFIFNKETKRITGNHYFWGEGWDVKEKWGTFDKLTQVALITENTISNVNAEGKVLQPASYESPVTTEFVFVERESL